MYRISIAKILEILLIFKIQILSDVCCVDSVIFIDILIYQGATTLRNVSDCNTEDMAYCPSGFAAIVL